MAGVPRDGTKVVLTAESGWTVIGSYDKLESAWMLTDMYDPVGTTFWLPNLLPFSTWRE